MIHEKSMLVTLNISTWTARKFDGKVSREVEKQNQAQNAGRFNKLLADPKFTGALRSATTSARSFHYENTLPWNNQGARLLPNTNYFQYIGAMNRYKQEFDKAVTEFLSVYENEVIADAKTRLGAMFNAGEFPTAAQLQEKFEFVLAIEPVAAGDFRLDMEAEEVEKIRADYESAVTAKVEGTVCDLRERIQTAVTAIRDRLSDKEAIFRDSLFGNLEQLLDIIPRLNVTGNKAITDLCKEAKHLLNDPGQIRTDAGLRGDTAAAASNILDKMKAMFAR